MIYFYVLFSLTNNIAYANINTWLQTTQTQSLQKNALHLKRFTSDSSTIALGTKQSIRSSYDLAKSNTQYLCVSL